MVTHIDCTVQIHCPNIIDDEHYKIDFIIYNKHVIILIIIIIYNYYNQRNTHEFR